MFEFLKQINDLGWILGALCTFIVSVILLFKRMKTLEGDVKNISVKMNSNNKELLDKFTNLSNVVYEIKGAVGVKDHV